MGDAADSMAAAIAADGGAGLPDGGGGVPPGTDGGSPPDPAGSSAGTQNTDTAGGGAPDTIPYARFKEVNESLNELKDFKPLVEFGYDPDSLGRLAAFEQQYLADPVGTWAGMAGNLDLPPDLKAAVEAHVASAAAGVAQGEPTGDPPRGLELPPEVQQKLDYVDQLRARDAEQERNAQLDRVVSHWDALDKKDEISTPQILKLNMIAALANSGQSFATVEELAEAAREPIVGYRGEVLGSAVSRTGRAGSPLAVPGSAPAPAAPVKFGSIREATRAAEEAMKRGELPGIQQ